MVLACCFYFESEVPCQLPSLSLIKLVFLLMQSMAQSHIWCPYIKPCFIIFIFIATQSVYVDNIFIFIWIKSHFLLTLTWEQCNISISTWDVSKCPNQIYSVEFLYRTEELKSYEGSHGLHTKTSMFSLVKWHQCDCDLIRSCFIWSSWWKYVWVCPPQPESSDGRKQKPAFSPSPHTHTQNSIHYMPDCVCSTWRELLVPDS